MNWDWWTFVIGYFVGIASVGFVIFGFMADAYITAKKIEKNNSADNGDLKEP